MMRILAIDQGTSSTKAVLWDQDGAVVARASCPLSSFYPQDGWAEQDADVLWDSVRGAITDIVAQTGAEGIAGLAIANQRETLVAWDADTGRPVAPAILWQDRRGAALCAALLGQGHGPAIEAATGLAANPLLTAAKLGWLLAHHDGARGLAQVGRLRAGTVDAWLLWRLTDGATFATDHGNASRTQLFDTARLAWSEELCAFWGIPSTCLPEPRPSDGPFGNLAATTALPAGLPILSVMGDSHAALYGHGVRAPGPVKATFGTGSSLMTLSGSRVASTNGLASTVAWSTQLGGPAYALEGNITVSAQAAAWTAEFLGLPDAAALFRLAGEVDSSEGVTFVPALAGLGAPHWDEAARGTVTGLSLASRPAHLARATLEAIALQVADVFEAMERDAGHRLDALRADGGASASDLLMQVEADLLDRPVTRGVVAEVGALGAAAMAFEALGQPMAAQKDEGRTFGPTMGPSCREAIRSDWHLALRRARLA